MKSEELNMAREGQVHRVQKEHLWDTTFAPPPGQVSAMFDDPSLVSDTTNRPGPRPTHPRAGPGRPLRPLLHLSRWTWERRPGTTCPSPA